MGGVGESVINGLVTRGLYLVLLAEVHPEHFGVALRPFDTMKSSSCSDGLLGTAVLTDRKTLKYMVIIVTGAA